MTCLLGMGKHKLSGQGWVCRRQQSTVTIYICRGIYMCVLESMPPIREAQCESRRQPVSTKQHEKLISASGLVFCFVQNCKSIKH